MVLSPILVTISQIVTEFGNEFKILSLILVTIAQKSTINMAHARDNKNYNNNQHNPKDLERDLDGEFKRQPHMTMSAGKLGFVDGSINNTNPNFGKNGMDKEPPSRTGDCGSIKCTATGTKVFKFYHVTKHRNKDKYYCMTCVEKFRDMGKKRAKKHRDKFGKTKNNTINTVPLIVPEIHLHFQKLNLPENPSPLFHMDKHQLFLMITEVSYQILSTVQKLISGGAWDHLCAPRWSKIEVLQHTKLGD